MFASYKQSIYCWSDPTVKFRTRCSPRVNKFVPSGPRFIAPAAISFDSVRGKKQVMKYESTSENNEGLSGYSSNTAFANLRDIGMCLYVRKYYSKHLI